MYASWRQVKKVPPSEVNVGDVVESYIQDGTYHSASDGWLVVGKMGAAITLQFLRGKPVQIALSTEGLMFEVPLTEEEYRGKYEARAQEIMQVLTADPLSPLSWDDHTMDNAWIDCDIWDFAAACEDQHVKVLGWFPLESVKHGWFQEYDIGIVGQDTDTDEIFWTHYNSEWIKDMEEWYNAVSREDK